MVSKFNIGDLVSYDNRLYKVAKIYAANWNMGVPFIYAITIVDSYPMEPLEGKLITVRENLLDIASEHFITVWKTLYGKKSKEP